MLYREHHEVISRDRAQELNWALTTQDLSVIAFLIFLEGILSIDNALVLALLAKPLPKNQRKKALTYGLFGAFAFRFIAIAMASYLIQWLWVRYLGGAYLLYVSGKELFLKKQKTDNTKQKHSSFWKTILIIELTDIAFAVDSVLAAVALSPKIEVVIAGGFIGLVLMRFAAGIFIGLLDKFPRFEQTAYLLVGLIGAKLIIEALELSFINFHDSSHPSFWAFWVIMVAILVAGFLPNRKKHKSS